MERVERQGWGTGVACAPGDWWAKTPAPLRVSNCPPQTHTDTDINTLYAHSSCPP